MTAEHDLRAAVERLAGDVKCAADDDWAAHSEAADMGDLDAANVHGAAGELGDALTARLRDLLAEHPAPQHEGVADVGALLGFHRCVDVHPDRHDQGGVGTCAACHGWGAHVAAALAPVIAAQIAQAEQRAAEKAWDEGYRLDWTGGVKWDNPYRAERDGCGVCIVCDAPRNGRFGFSRMYVCATCGNKRCPAAADCQRWECSGSNDPGQVPVPRADRIDQP